MVSLVIPGDHIVMFILINGLTLLSNTITVNAFSYLTFIQLGKPYLD